MHPLQRKRETKEKLLKLSLPNKENRKWKTTSHTQCIYVESFYYSKAIRVTLNLKWHLTKDFIGKGSHYAPLTSISSVFLLLTIIGFLSWEAVCDKFISSFVPFPFSYLGSSSLSSTYQNKKKRRKNKSFMLDDDDDEMREWVHDKEGGRPFERE